MEKLIDLPKGAKRDIGDIFLSRYACYLIVQNADPSKEVIALGQTYFAVQTRKQELFEELKKHLEKERDIAAEKVFKELISSKKLHFFLITDKGGYKIPPRIQVRNNKQLVRDDNTSIQRSLFDVVPEENINELEKSVAIYLDKQEKLFWWYRNMSKQDYHIQDWKKNRIYPDFITSKSNDIENDYGDVYIFETKGLHLKNDDTKYKQDVFELCNELGIKKQWKDLGFDFPDKKFQFQVIYDDEWKNKINKIFV